MFTLKVQSNDVLIINKTLTKQECDSKVREEFVTECIQNLINHDARDIRFIQDFDVDLEKEKLFNKWGSHIASLRQEIRHKRLKRLV